MHAVQFSVVCRIYAKPGGILNIVAVKVFLRKKDVLCTALMSMKRLLHSVKQLKQR